MAQPPGPPGVYIIYQGPPLAWMQVAAYGLPPAPDLSPDLLLQTLIEQGVVNHEGKLIVALHDRALPLFNPRFETALNTFLEKYHIQHLLQDILQVCSAH